MPPEPLLDFSPEGRRHLIEARGVELRFLLDEAFTNFCDTRDLRPMGFRGDDPVTEAVDWCIDAFLSDRFDPRQVRDKSTTLFTCPDFWLSWKVGRQAWRAQQGWQPDPGVSVDTLTGQGASAEHEQQDLALEQTRQKMAATLAELGRRCCAGLVLHWLEGTEQLRARLFRWTTEATTPDPEASKKSRSFRRHDALLRYLALFLGLIDEHAEDEAHRALALTRFSPCEDTPPFRVPTETLANSWSPARNPNELQRLSKRGVEALIIATLDQTEAPAESPQELLTQLLLRHGLGPTTAHAYKIDDPPLMERLKALPAPPVRG